MAAMPRRPREAAGNVIYHVLNRRAGRQQLFHHKLDYLAFLRTIRQANGREMQQARPPVEIFSICLMPNHWHLVLRPMHDGQLSAWMRWLQVTHTQRYHAAHQSSGEGPIYQGRFRSHPVEEPQPGDAVAFQSVCAYVEGNAVRAGLCRRVGDWPWGSYAMRAQYGPTVGGLLTPPPVPWPRDWERIIHDFDAKGSGVASTGTFSKQTQLDGDS